MTRITYGKNHRRAKPAAQAAGVDGPWHCRCGAERPSHSRGERGRGGWLLLPGGVAVCDVCARKLVRVRFELSAILYVPCEVADAWNVFADAIRHPDGSTRITDYVVRRREQNCPPVELSVTDRSALRELLARTLAELLAEASPGGEDEVHGDPRDVR